MRIFVHIPSQTLDLLDDSGVLLRRYAGCAVTVTLLGKR